MKKIIFSLFLFSLLISRENNVLHAATRGHSTETADFLRVTPDSHSAALGHTGVINRDSDFSIYHNPSLITFKARNKFRLAGSQMNWIAGITANHYAFSFAVPSPKKSPWGIGVFMSEWRTGQFNSTDRYGNITGDIEYKAQNIGLSLSHGIFKELHLGATVKRISQNFAQRKSGLNKNTERSAYAGDIGVSYKTPLPRISMGLSAQNIGQSMTFDDKEEKLPFQIRWGLQRQSIDQRFHWNLEILHNRENKISVKNGIGFNAFSNVTFRGGYDTFFSQPNYVGLTSGLGIKFQDLQIDYSFVPFGELGITQRVSLSWRWGQIKPLKNTGKYLWKKIYRSWLYES